MSLQECTTADDVRKLAQRTLERHRQMMRPTAQPEPIKKIAVEAEDGYFASLSRRLDALEKSIQTVLNMCGVEIKTGEMTGPKYLLLADIRNVVSDYYGVTLQELDQKSQAIKIARVRQIACYLCRLRTLRSLPEIGRMFGGRDHTTILHSVNKIADMRKTDPIIDSDLIKLEALLDNLLSERQGAMKNATG